MRTLFIIKYLGKTLLITCALLAMGKIAGMAAYYNTVVILAALSYAFGSIEYQTRLRRKKSNKQLNPCGNRSTV